MTASVAINVRHILRIASSFSGIPMGRFERQTSVVGSLRPRTLNQLAGLQLHHVQLDQGATQKQYRSAYIRDAAKVRWCSEHVLYSQCSSSARRGSGAFDVGYTPDNGAKADIRGGPKSCQ